MQLENFSKKDKCWTKHKREAVIISDFYGNAREYITWESEAYRKASYIKSKKVFRIYEDPEFARYLSCLSKAERMEYCGKYLQFGFYDTSEGEVFKVKKASFCHVRYCPVCQWRRSLMWQARVLKGLPILMAQYPKASFLFLTLTVRNTEIENLRDTLNQMNRAWHNLLRRSLPKSVLGGIKTTEVTRGKDGSAHPHFHVMFMVTQNYFAKEYLSQKKITELWQKYLKVSYTPVVDIRVVRNKKRQSELPVDAIFETLKYSVKVPDMLDDQAWFIELDRQTKKLRFISKWGVFENILKEKKEETDLDFLLVDLNDGILKEILTFLWSKNVYVLLRREKEESEETKIDIFLNSPPWVQIREWKKRQELEEDENEDYDEEEEIDDS